jgi:hypothetical protein
MTKRRLPVLVALVAAALALTALPASAASRVVLHYFGTNATGTEAADTSGHDNDGALHHVRWTGTAYAFHGPRSYIETSATRSVNPGTKDFSYSVKIKLLPSTVYSHDLSLVRRGSSKFKGAYYKMEMVYDKATASMLLECAFRDANGQKGYVSTSGNGLNDGVWHTLTCSKTATTVSLSKDTHVYTRPATLGDLSSTVPMFFGVEQIGAHAFWEQFPGHMKAITLTKG